MARCTSGGRPANIVFSERFHDLGGSIALLLPESKTARYESQDRPNFEKKVKELCSDCPIIYSNADQDAAKQQQQAEAAITKGAKVLVLDPVDAASAAGTSLKDYLAAHNPMFPSGEAELAPFVTELDLPHGESFLVVVNNSLLPLGDGHPLGVLHKAVIPRADPSASRVINSMGLMLAGDPSAAPRDAAAVEHFLTRTDLD